MSTQQTLTLFPLSSYTFTTKAAQPEEDPSVAARLQRLQNQYEDLGLRHTAEGVLVVHDHGHPHVLMIQIANAFFKLPGNYLRPAEEETSGLARRLDEQLAPVEDDPNSYGPGGMSAGNGGDWEIGDCLAQWWRPSFETFMVSLGFWNTTSKNGAHAFCGNSQNLLAFFTISILTFHHI